MKKVLLALTLVAFLATSASALEVLGGKLGVGVEMIDLDGAGANPFVSLDYGALQVRVAPNVVNVPKTSSTSNLYDDSQTSLMLSGLYSLGSGNWAPYVGGRLLWINNMSNDGSPTAQTRTIATQLSIPVGVKWMVLNNVNFYVEMDAYKAGTVIVTSKDDDTTVMSYGPVTNGNEWFDTSARLGAVLYL